ncbi:hypothetical protein [Chryseosolibacter indicus]|uniref:Glycosyltransferase RgtA/B/C/D-like domain-containing protein n=1 Tax=Chryseosolibacter indicus TaxID=2782351 RepID=A0ABS5W1Z6_9BACT|nr:hypothetical protein [Chryseosolibacter indicus]MBT1706276.1 hypothetical protein [Chryseosolibacter indicus]
MSVFLYLLHIIFIVGILWRLSAREDKQLKFFYLSAASFKIACGIMLGVIYHHYYATGDTLIYFHEANTLVGIAKNDAGAFVEFLLTNTVNGNKLALEITEARAVLFIKFVALINLATSGNYWITTAYFSLISFFASWYLVKKIIQYKPGLKKAALLAFAFLPSAVFWSSGIIKESLAAASLFYLTALFIEFWDRGKIGLYKLISVVPAVWILWGLKYYFLGIFVPVVFTNILFKTLFYRLLEERSLLLKAVTWVGIFVLPLVAITFIHPNLYMDRVLEVIVSNQDAYNSISLPEDKVQFNDLKPTLSSFIVNVPLALFSGIYRPVIIEAGNVFQFISSVENLMLLILTLSAIKNIHLLFHSKDNILLLSIVVYVVLLCILITLSTPNFGTLSRYRVGYLPYFVFLVSLNNPLISFITSMRCLAQKQVAK